MRCLHHKLFGVWRIPFRCYSYPPSPSTFPVDGSSSAEGERKRENVFIGGCRSCGVNYFAIDLFFQTRLSPQLQRERYSRANSSSNEQVVYRSRRSLGTLEEYIARRDNNLYRASFFRNTQVKFMSLHKRPLRRAKLLSTVRRLLAIFQRSAAFFTSFSPQPDASTTAPIFMRELSANDYTLYGLLCVPVFIIALNYIGRHAVSNVSFGHDDCLIKITSDISSLVCLGARSIR